MRKKSHAKYLSYYSISQNNIKIKYFLKIRARTGENNKAAIIQRKQEKRKNYLRSAWWLGIN
jgi:hypothetical protein